MASRISVHPGVSQLHSIKRYESVLERMYARILSFFNLSLCVYDEKRNAYFYFKTKDITQTLCTIAPSTTLQHLVVENLNPLIGEDVTLEKVENFFKKFQSARFMEALDSCGGGPQAAELVRARLERFKLRHVKVIAYNRAALLRRLKPGDLIFSRPTQQTRVTLGQRFMAPFIRGKKERKGHKFSHVSIYIGNGKLVEAWEKKPLHIVDISERRFALEIPERTYVVSRCKDAELAAGAADVANQIALQQQRCCPNSKLLKYSHALAVQSLFASPRFGANARYRYFKQYLNDINHQIPSSFFCSYFVGYCYQVAESRRLVPELASDIPRGEGPSAVKAMRRTLWANGKRWKLWRSMDDRIQFTCDPKRMTPHELRNFVLKRRDLFRDRYLITAQKKSYSRSFTKKST